MGAEGSAFKGNFDWAQSGPNVETPTLTGWAQYAHEQRVAGTLHNEVPWLKHASSVEPSHESQRVQYAPNGESLEPAKELDPKDKARADAIAEYVKEYNRLRETRSDGLTGSERESLNKDSFEAYQHLETALHCLTKETAEPLLKMVNEQLTGGLFMAIEKNKVYLKRKSDRGEPDEYLTDPLVDLNKDNDCLTG